MLLATTIVLATLHAVEIHAATLSRDSPTPVKLAVSPKCGTLGGSVGDVNAGIGSLSSYDTIISFGVSSLQILEDMIT